MSQFFYIHPDNPQLRLIKQAVEIIRNGHVIVYPTDSGYSIGCQMDNKQALEQICQIRNLDKNHNLIDQRLARRRGPFSQFGLRGRGIG